MDLLTLYGIIAPSPLPLSAHYVRYTCSDCGRDTLIPKSALDHRTLRLALAGGLIDIACSHCHGLHVERTGTALA